MTKFQKIAVGLLGLTHPEMFILKFRPDSKSPTKIELSCDRRSTESIWPWRGQGARLMRAFRFMLGARATDLYGSGED